MSVIDTATNAVSGMISFGTSGPTGLAISPDGSILYVVASGEVSMINTATSTIIGPLASGRGVIVSPDGTHLYLDGSNSITVISMLA